MKESHNVEIDIKGKRVIPVTFRLFLQIPLLLGEQLEVDLVKELGGALSISTENSFWENSVFSDIDSNQKNNGSSL